MTSLPRGLDSFLFQFDDGGTLWAVAVPGRTFEEARRRFETMSPAERRRSAVGRTEAAPNDIITKAGRALGEAFAGMLRPLRPARRAWR